MIIDLQCTITGILKISLDLKVYPVWQFLALKYASGNNKVPHALFLK